MAFYGSLFVFQGSDYMTNIMGLALAVYKWVLTLWVVIGPYSNQCGTDAVCSEYSDIRIYSNILRRIYSYS